jgi:hypothetical protein
MNVRLEPETEKVLDAVIWSEINKSLLARRCTLIVLIPSKASPVAEAETTEESEDVTFRVTKNDEALADVNLSIWDIKELILERSPEKKELFFSRLLFRSFNWLSLPD